MPDDKTKTGGSNRKRVAQDEPLGGGLLRHEARISEEQSRTKWSGLLWQSGRCPAKIHPGLFRCCGSNSLLGCSENIRH